MKQATSKSGNVGRPAGREGDEVRADLLRAAREHFLKRDFKAVSLREIASSAGVNGAMINYYFGGKRGLYMAMVDEVFESLDVQMQKMHGGADYTVADFSRSYSMLLVENPWWPNFFVREILFSEGETKEAVMQRISTLIAPKLLESIRAEIDRGHYRKELKPEFTILSLMGMTIFPFLAAPMVERVFSVSLDRDSAAAIATHNVDLFLHGVLASDQQVSGGTQDD